MQSIVVTYAKFVDDKELGVYLQGVYLGGIAINHEEAEQIATECVNNIKGAIPKLMPVEGKHCAVKAMDSAIKVFARMEADMIESEEIMARNKR